MNRHGLRPFLALATLCALAAPRLAAAQQPDVNTPPPLGAICPAIDDGYRLCGMDALSPDCGVLVDAARALGQRFLFNVEREPARTDEFTSTIWWGCGTATLPQLKAALGQLDSPAARDLLASAPWSELPVPVSVVTPPAPPGPVAPASAEPDCSKLVDPAALAACQQKALAVAEAHYRSELARCEAKLTPFLRQQLVASEAAWQRDRGMECEPDDTQTACLAAATEQRADGIARSNPQCAPGAEAPIADVREGPEKGGQRTGLLPARWTPPKTAKGASQDVPFSFESFGGDESQGRMQTTLGDGGEHFVGDYLRIEQSTKGDLVTAMSVSWSGPEWQLWKPDGEGGWTEEGVSVGEFADFYTGKVVATLRGDRGHAMRCQFALTDAEEGFLQGGTGRCQVSDGGALALSF